MSVETASARVPNLPLAAMPSGGGLAAFLAANAHRCFFTAGILITLTAGAAWGVRLLWQIGATESFTAVSIHQVNAHGHAQIFGWIGLFVIGASLRLFPTLWRVPLAFPGLVPPIFLSMLAGMGLSIAGEAGAGSWAGAVTAVRLGGALETAAATAFAIQMLITFRRSAEPMAPWTAFVFSGFGWFIVMAALSAWYTGATVAAQEREELLALVAGRQAVLRNAQIHGLAFSMIFGVALRMLPDMLGVARTPDRRAWWAFVLLLVAAVGESLSFLTYRATGSHACMGVMFACWMLFPAALALLAGSWRLWWPAPEPGRSAKFVRAAFAWLTLSLTLMLLLPLHQRISGLPFSHAYYGAIRHATTVGFVSLMIMGMASWMTPRFRGMTDAGLSPLWGPFALVNMGCALRVGLQIGTDWSHASFAIIGVSGTLELAGLAWWAAHTLRVMHRRSGKGTFGPACLCTRRVIATRPG